MVTIDERVREVITEHEVRQCAAGDTLLIADRAIVTPLALDAASENGVRIERAPWRRAGRRLRIALGADHGGFEAKERLKPLLSDLGHEFRDFGTTSPEPVDYPDVARVAAEAVARGSCDLGIIIDGAGIGSCMVANKVPGVRAAMCYDVATARNSREHNGANVLTLGGKMITEDAVREIVRAWLETELTEDRHRRRVAKIDLLDRDYRQR